MTKIEGYIDFDKELESEQYNSLEYIQGEHDGVVETIGLIQRLHRRGENMENIVDALFSLLYDKFDKYKEPSLLKKELEIFEHKAIYYSSKQN